MRPTFLPTLAKGGLLAIALAVTGSGVFAQETGGINPLLGIMAQNGITKMYAHNAILVAFKDGFSDSQKLNIVRQYGLSVDPNVDNPYFARLIVSEAHLKRESLHTIMDRLNADGRFRYAETDNMIFPDQSAPDDPSFSQQYAMHNTGQTGGLVDADIDALEGYGSINMSATPIIVAVADDGFQITHPDLAANMYVNPNEIAGNSIDDDGNGFIDDTNGWDFSDNDRDVAMAGTQTHGMHVAGIVGMVHNNQVGGAGAAKNVRMMPVRMYGGANNFISALANSVDYAWRNGAKIITVSYNIDGYTQTLVDAIGRAKAADMVYCNSAGNNNQNINTLRGAIRNIHNNTVFVASTDRSDLKSSFSNFGTTVDIAAPGSDIYSTLRNNTYGLNSGTSMAAPCGAAVIAMIRLNFPNLSAAQAIQRAKNTSDLLSTFTTISGGRVNLARALDDDAIAPSDPTDLIVCKRSTNAIQVQFKGSGDDGLVGNAAGYEVRSSSAPITAANFNSATLVTSLAGGVPAGTPITAQVSGLTPGQSIYVAVRAIDNVANSSVGVASLGPITLPVPSFYDNVEGAALWNSTTWGVTTAQASSGTKSWTDSPTGNYANNINTILTLTNPLAVSANQSLRFRANISTESDYDFLIGEFSTNGTTWTRFFRFTGSSGGWKTYGVSMAQFAGQNVQVRFRLTSDGSVVQDGVYLDDIALVDVTQVAFDNAEGAANFTSSAWTRSSARFFSPTQSWTDSAGGNYAANTNSDMQGTVALNLAGLSDPMLTFNGYMTMARFDDVYAISSVNGGAWTQGAVYTGVESAWALFSSALPASSNVRFGLRIITDPSTENDGIFADDFRVTGETWLNFVGGTVDLDGYAGNGRPLTLTVGSGSYAAPLTAGAFNVKVNETGNQAIYLDGPGYLRKSVGTFNLTLCDVSGVNVELVNGDINNDNEIGPADFAALSAAFGSFLGDANFNALADLNGDDEVGPADFAKLAENFGQFGD